MSHKATAWAIQQRGLRPIKRVLLWELADCHHPENGCFPSQTYLAERCEISRASVNTLLDELEREDKLISRKSRKDASTKRQLSTRYMLAFEDGFIAIVDRESRVSILDTALSKTRVQKNAVSVSKNPSRGEGTSNKNQEPPLPPSNILERVRVSLLGALDEDHADAIIADREALGAPLSEAEACTIASHCQSYPDPSIEAEALIASRYRRCRGLRRPAPIGAASQAGEKGPGPRSGPEGYISRADEPLAFAKAIELTRQNWKADWKAVEFDPAVAQRARRAVASAAEGASA